MRKSFHLLFLILILSGFLECYGIEPTWQIDFGSVFDNREGDAKTLEPRTFFFTTLSAEIGLKFGQKDRIAAGATWNQPLENGVKDGKILPVVYYRHEGQEWKFSMGMFPRTQLREPLPGFLWCDSMAYFQRTVRGALIQFQRKQGFFDAYIDWRGMQTKERREAFNIVFHGEWRPKLKSMLLGGHLMMNHFAKTRVPNEGQNIVDNFLVNPYLGFDFSKKCHLDSLVLKTGLLMTVERHRGVSDGWATPSGYWLEILGEWQFLGLRNSLYAGGKLFPLYGEYGTLLYQGEAYYRSSFYDRFDIYTKIYRNKFLNLEAQLNFNFTKESFMFYQRLILNINLGNI